MASHKIGRASEEIKKEISEMIRELKDPRISGLLSIVNVDLTRDFSFCTVYISSLEGMEQTKEAVEGLKSASGFIRRELKRKLRIRKVPELIFVADDGIEYSANIDKLITDLNKKPSSSGEADEN